MEDEASRDNQSNQSVHRNGRSLDIAFEVTQASEKATRQSWRCLQGSVCSFQGYSTGKEKAVKSAPLALPVARIRRLSTSRLYSVNVGKWTRRARARCVDHHLHLESFDSSVADIVLLEPEEWYNLKMHGWADLLIAGGLKQSILRHANSQGLHCPSTEMICQNTLPSGTAIERY